MTTPSPLAGAHGWRRALLLAAEWAMLLAAIGLWMASKYYSPQMSLGSALVAGSWLARWLRLGRLTRPTPLDFPIVLFLLSAVMGMWVAPDRTAALVRFYLLLAAVALFYALVNAGPASLRLCAGLFVLAAGALGLYFPLQNDWAARPAKLAFVGSLGSRLDPLLPDLGLYKPHPNVVAGVVALALPIAVAGFVGEARRVRQAGKSMAGAALGLAVFGLGGLAVLFGVLMVESRTAWLALAVAAALVGWWWLASKLSGLTGTAHLFWIGVAVVAVAVAAAFFARPDLFSSAFGSLPGPNSLVSRVEIYGQVWRLAQDMPFTGGGLDSFPGLYAFYILSTPSPFLTHAHNAYLNVLVEQGWPGFIGYTSLVVVGLWAAARQVRQNHSAVRPLIVGGTLAMAVAALSGLGDGVLVASRAIPAALIPAGLALAGWPEPIYSEQPATDHRYFWPALAALFVVALVGAGLFFQRPLQAAWFANLGVVNQQRIELADGTTGEWETGNRPELFTQAEPYLQRAVQYQPANRTANYRLGLIALARNDFEEAANRLEQAYQVDRNHRGVIKALGFTYVWLGDFDSASRLLASIPETSSELSVYEWWWETQGRPDLSERAKFMALRVQS